MRKLATLLVVVGLVLTVLWVLPVFNATEGELGNSQKPRGRAGATLYVGDGQTYTKIKDAIDAASPGDTIRVYEGSYQAAIDIYKSLTLIGNGSTNTSIYCTSYNEPLGIYANWMNISDFTIIGQKDVWKPGIWLHNVENCRISNINFSNNAAGFVLSTSSNNIIENNTIDSNWVWRYDINLRSSTNNIIRNNTCKSNYDAGIHLESSSNNNTLINNRCTSTSNNKKGIYMDSSSNNTLENNTCSNNGYGIYLAPSSNSNTIINNTCNSNAEDGILLYNSNNNIIYNNIGMYNSENGIYLVYSDSNTLTNNTCNSNNDYGIYLSSSLYNTLLDNSMVDNGIKIAGQLVKHWNTHEIDTSNKVNGKPVYYWKNVTSGGVPSGAGQVILANCTNIKVESQNISNGAIGILVGFSTNNNITKNYYSNNDYGIFIIDSESNTIINNIVSSNNKYGIYLYDSDNNKIYHNNFIENVKQAYDNRINQWNLSKPWGGNYWSNWTTPDNDKDDFIDKPYNIDESTGAKDYLPLVYPWGKYPPRIITQYLQKSYVDQLYSVNYTAFDMDTPNNKLIWTMKTNATWLTFSSSQRLYGTPSSSDIGSYWVNISVSDGHRSDFTYFTLTVSVKIPPKITTTNVLKALVGLLYTVNYTAITPDTPQDNLIWSMNTNASWLNFSLNQELFGTPSNSDIGSYWVNISVSDNKFIDFTNFTLTVLENILQITTMNILTTYVGQVFFVNYTASYSDIPQISLTWTMKTNASWLDFSPNQELYGVPSSSDIGWYWVNISVHDGYNDDFTNFTLTVLAQPPPPNKPPQITTQNVLKAYVSKYYLVNYTATDPDTPEYNLLWSMNTNASWLNFSSIRELYGTPSSLDVGPHWVNISVSDGEFIDFTNFTITVKAYGSPQITTPNILIAYVGLLYLINYTADDPDSPQDNLTWSMNTNASWLNFSPSQELYGIPKTSDVGSYWVYIEVSDGANNDFTNFTLDVKEKDGPDIILPEIKSTSILNNSYNISIDIPEIEFEFSKPMNTSSFEGAIDIIPVIPFDLQWKNHKTVLKIIFNETLLPSTKYTITITNTVMDQVGNQLVSTFILVFNTKAQDINGEPDKPGEIDLETILSFFIVFVIIIIVLAILFIVQSRRKVKARATETVRQPQKRREVKGIDIIEKDAAEEELDIRNSEEYLKKLMDDALQFKKPSEFKTPEVTMLTNAEEKYRKGEISKITYDSILETLSGERQ